MHRPLIRAGTLLKVLPSYLVALAPTLAMIAGLVVAIETIVHYTVNPGDDSHIKAFGVGFDAASPLVWGLSAILLIGGYFVARMTWRRIGQAWSEATTVARDKGGAA
jgi:branched-chain amino acid transport system permease protein